MSTIYIKNNHDETVFDWENNKKISQTNKIDLNTIKLYRKSAKSKQRDNNNNDNLKLNRTVGSLGYFETPIRKPCDYLKKGEGNNRLKRTKSEQRICLSSERRPQIPAIFNLNSDQEHFNKKVIKNFKLENIKAIKNMIPKNLKLKYVDTRKGDSHELHKSGMIPEYINKRKFGKIPRYSIKIKSHLMRNDDNKSDEQYLSSNDFKLDDNFQSGSNLRRIESAERLDILNGLKKNWMDLQQKYQKLPILTDTEFKKKRKTKIENELKNYEKDILMIENNPIIYVYNE